MRNYLFLILFFLVGCSNEIDLNEDPKEIPVTYAIVDPADEFQYFRVERVFLDPSKPATEVSQDPTQLYFDDITVRLKNGVREVELERVDGDEEGLPREADGVFASSPNILYKANTADLDLETDDKLELSIDGIYDDRSVSAETRVIAKPGFSSFREGSAITFLEDRVLNVGWSQREGNEVYAVTMYIDVTEVDRSNGTQTPKTLTWNIASATKDERVEIPGISFYQFMSSSFDAQENVVRFLGSVSFEITAGDATLDAINRISNANLGITSSGEIPTFTNMSEGLGIFAAKNSVRVNNLSFSGETKELLRNGPLTAGLNFQ